MGGAAGLGGLIMNGGGAPPGEMNPALFQSMMSNSMMQNMMQQVMSNPEMLRTIINSNPLLSQMAVGHHKTTDKRLKGTVFLSPSL